MKLQHIGSKTPQGAEQGIQRTFPIPQAAGKGRTQGREEGRGGKEGGRRKKEEKFVCFFSFNSISQPTGHH